MFAAKCVEIECILVEANVGISNLFLLHRYTDSQELASPHTTCPRDFSSEKNDSGNFALSSRLFLVHLRYARSLGVGIGDYYRSCVSSHLTLTEQRCDATQKDSSR